MTSEIPSPILSPHDGLLLLPDGVLVAIFQHLDVLDRCSLALSSWRLMRLATAHMQLNYDMHHPPTHEQLQNFFENRLAPQWKSKCLRYCSDCGKFVTTNGKHWRGESEKNTRERAGRIAELWRNRREDGWLRYWIERWADGNSTYEQDATARMLRRDDQTAVVCPPCAIQSPECNSWRTKLTSGGQSWGTHSRLRSDTL